MDDRQILEVWAQGQRRPTARPLLLLAAARPDLPIDELAALPVGACNRLLLGDRRATFGEALEADATCPGCGERLEVALRPADLLCMPGAEQTRGELVVADTLLCFRPPTRADLDAAATVPDVDGAVLVLLERCVTATGPDGQRVPAEQLPAQAVDALEDAMSRQDPDADLRLAMTCVGCHAPFEVSLDPARLYWDELADHARRLLHDVHRLAAAYGWTEAEVLALGPVRREAYLELTG
jgi:hypothetical protein